MNAHGYNQGSWALAKEEEAHRVLLDRAGRRMGQTISYSDLSTAIQAIHFEPDDHLFHVMLGEISEEEHAKGRGMLSVLVVHKSGDQMPGPGFFDLANSLGHDVRDKVKFWAEEMTRVLRAHKK